MQHSKAPFAIQTDEDAAHGKIPRYIVSADGILVADLWADYPDINLGLPEQTELQANARLLKAAPKLLDALKKLLPMWESGIDEPWVYEARAAIREAEGE